MSSVVESVDVNAPVSTVYNQWTQFESFPEFMGGVERITQTDDTHTHWVTKIGGVRREFDTEITEQRPDERVAWKSTDGTTHAGVVTFHRLNQGMTRVTAQIEWHPEGLVEKAGAAVGVDDRQVKADLERFKEFIEHHGSETGAWRGEVEGGEVRDRNGGTSTYGSGGTSYGTEGTSGLSSGTSGLASDTPGTSYGTESGMPGGVESTGSGLGSGIRTGSTPTGDVPRSMPPTPGDMPSTAPGWGTGSTASHETGTGYEEEPRLRERDDDLS